MTATATRSAARPPARAPRTPRRRVPLPALLIAIVAALDLAGIVMVLSSSSVHALRQYGSAWMFFQRQLLWLALGTIALGLFAWVDYRRWMRFAPALLVVSLGLLMLVLVPGMGISVNGSTRWLGAGAIRIQPSELAKLALLVFTATVLARRADEMGDPRRTLWPVLIVSGTVGLLVMAQPDMGTTLTALCIVMSILWVGGTPFRHIGLLSVAGSGGAFVLGMAEPYRRDRILAFLDPWKDSADTGYQTVQGMVAVAGGGWPGLGLGASRAKWGFLPNAHTDFIFAIVAEELGLLGALLIIGLFVAFGVVGVVAALRAPDRFGMLLAAGITTWIVGQALINMGAVIGLLPVTGVPMPFVSFGGSSLVVLMGAVGILLNVVRQGEEPRLRRARLRARQ
jgi:cell division protein FtsW